MPSSPNTPVTPVTPFTDGGSAKRAMDVVLSAAALLLLSPLLAAAALAVRIDSAGPVLFRQTRIGRHGRAFGMLKFRSMVVDPAGTGAYFTAAADPRITRVGRWLRRFSIDELPQLWNVLCGDMSLVGPRPDVPQQRALYTDADWAARCSVRPGITGLAQVRLRSEATQAQRLALDLDYVRSAGVRRDLRILLGTLGRLSGQGGN